MKTCALLALLCLMAAPAWATHLLGGHIQVRYVSSTTYEITVSLFMDETAGRIAADQTNSISLCLGDGTLIPVVRASRSIIAGVAISINQYKTTHAYSAPGVYRIAVNAENRTSMINLNQGTDNLFSIATTIQVNSAARNTTPVFEPPLALWQAATNQRTALSLRATDADGDSLAYLLTRPLTTTGASECRAASAVPQYQFPNDVARVGTYKLNSRTGELVWDAPTRAGQYAASILIQEWRAGVLISETYAENTIRVQDRTGTTNPIPPYEPAAQVPTVITATESEVDGEVQVFVFPNPVQVYLQASLQTVEPTAVHIQLLDLSGRVIVEEHLSQRRTVHEHTIGVADLPTGVYVLNVNLNGKTVRRKIIKQ